MILIVALSVLGFKNKKFLYWAFFDLIQIQKRKAYYRLVTSTLVHLDLTHLAFNLFSLNSFAKAFDMYLGPWYATAIFFITAIAANVFVMIWYRKRHEYYALGASGGVSGVIFASIWLLPSSNLYLLFIPFPISDRIFGILYLAISAFYMAKGEGKIGHSAHLGGAIMGLLCGLFIQPQKAVEEPQLLLWFVLPFIIVPITKALLRLKEKSQH